MATSKKRQKSGTLRNVAVIRVNHCHQCQFKKVLADPDPDDWFCDDDVKVVCTKKNGKIITSACRPYNVKKECDGIPNWCPLLEGGIAE